MKKEKSCGLEQGEQVGIEKGRHSQNIENAKKMLEEGIEISIITKITGITEKEIKDSLK